MEDLHGDGPLQDRVEHPPDLAAAARSDQAEVNIPIMAGRIDQTTQGARPGVRDNWISIAVKFRHRHTIGVHTASP
jgi:hypothetical protein